MSRPPWIILWALNVITDVLLSERQWWIKHTHTEEEAICPQRQENGGMWSQVKESWQQPKAERN